MAQLSSCIHLFNKFVTLSKFCKTLQWSHYPLCTKIAVVRYIKFRLFQFRSPLLSESLVYFLLVLLLRCFSSQAFPCKNMDSSYNLKVLTLRGFPIRISADLDLLAVPRSLSQLYTSFVGCQYQGIPH